MLSDIPALSYEILGRPLRAYIWAATVFVVLVVALRIIRSLIIRQVGALARRTPTEFDDLIVNLVKNTRSFVLVIVSAYVAAYALRLPPNRMELLRSITVAFLLIQAALWGNQVIHFMVDRYRKKRGQEDAAGLTTISTLGFVAMFVLWSVLILLALDNFGIKITGLVAGLGIGGVAVALAAQEVLKDLFASFAILLDKPFLIGDFIIVGDFLGTVSHIGIKTTRIRSLSGEELIFANSDLLNSRIRNYKRMLERRVVSNFGVLYQTPAAQIEAIPEMVKEIVRATPNVRLDRAHFQGFGDSALTFEFVYYVLNPDYTVYMDVQQSIHLAILRKFEAEGISFAYPTRTLFMEGRLVTVPASSSEVVETDKT